MKLSDLVLTDITFKNEHGKLTVVGRPQVEGSATKQMRHIIPYSFVKMLIQSQITDSTCPQEVFTLLSKTILLFANSQNGYAVSSKNLEAESYNDIAELRDISNRSMSSDDGTIFLASPTKADALKWTPKKLAKAKVDFSIFNTKFIKEALDKFGQALKHSDDNTFNIAAEALARFIFIIFNKNVHSAFAKEGNTANYELRLYPSNDSALKAGNDYKVVKARELKAMAPMAINECLRIVECEGSKVKETPKALKSIDNIILNYNMFAEINVELLDLYNRKYNYQLNLANYDTDISKYNQALTKLNYTTLVPYHLAKLLYVVFDLKALEKIVVVPDRKEGKLTFFTSASGNLTSQYKLDDGDEIRADEREGARGYSHKEVFRNHETDLSILAQKLTELFVIATTPFAAMQAGFLGLANKFINLSLDKLADLAAFDYQMNPSDSLKLKQEVFEIFTTLTNNSDDHDSIEHLSIIGASEYDGILQHSAI
ncbi:MAG: hypothetical protein NWP61_03810 [Rickettsiaceae bacterium]|nr:hypothetical protein [Rickettsiaceae bacterium]